MMENMNNEIIRLRSGEGSSNGPQTHGGSHGNTNWGHYGRLTKV